jgi:chitosanase
VITEEQKQNIKEVINVAEMGTKNIRYSDVYVYSDGPNDIKQLTLSAGFTEFGGNLKTVLTEYVVNHGQYADFFKPYLSKIGKIPSLYTDLTFKSTLKLAGKDPVMQKAQEKVLEGMYYKPALEWFEANGFVLPLSLLVIYDSFIHSGGVLMMLRRRFSESTPKNGGNEKKWIESYVDVRHQWLKYHSRAILRNTIYRTTAYKTYIKLNNWDLSQRELMNGVLI